MDAWVWIVIAVAAVLLVAYAGRRSKTRQRNRLAQHDPEGAMGRIQGQGAQDALRYRGGDNPAGGI